MFRKSLSAILIILLVCGIFVSCSREPEEGTIEDIELTEPAHDDSADSKFTKAESPFSYDYGTFALKKAHMRFDVPKSWETTFVNARYVVIQTPNDDSYLPATTISLLCNYGEDVDENEMSMYTLNNHAYNFSEFFKNELEGLPTYTDGMNRHLRTYVAEDEIRNGLDFVDEEHAEDAATLIADKVVLVDKTNKYYIDECGMVSTYVKWDGSPYCFNAIARKENIEHATAMMEYMVSSITYEPTDKDGFKEVSYADFTTYVPSTFVPVTGAENIYFSPLTENRTTAGMAVGVFTLDDGYEETLTAENIAKSFGETIAALCFSAYDTNALYMTQAEECTEEGGPDFTGTIGVDCTGYSEPSDVAGTLFGPYSYYLADYYVTEKDGRPFIIAVVYQKSQTELARSIGKTAVNKLR